ncbi:MAG: hypothetical protein K6E38_00715 [Fretibacterium sp.]|nr:hypothetical protein [Fretibacterium sp.]
MALPSFAAEKTPPAMERWIRRSKVADRDGTQEVTLKVTYYANEYVDALVKSEAEKNLWTQDEMENYRYTLLKTINLQDSLPFHIDLYVTGVPMYPAPFDKHIYLMIGKKRYTPSDYDKRFNFKVSGGRDGMVHFPRYDPKTGEDVLKGAKDVRLFFDASITYAQAGKGDFMWVWDITKDKPAMAGDGKAEARLEVDRLLRRMEKLDKERQELQGKLDTLNKELGEINSRIDELQSR